MQDDSTPNTNGGGVELSWDDLTPREVRVPEGVKTLESPTAPRSRPEEDGRGRGGGDENSPTARPNREQTTNGGDGAAPRGAAAMEDAEAETGTEKRAGGAGRPKSHPISAAAAAAVGGPVTAGPAPDEKENQTTPGTCQHTPPPRLWPRQWEAQ